MLILMYAFIVLVLFLYCQVDFDVDNVQRRELVIFLQGIVLYYKRYYYYYIIIKNTSSYLCVKGRTRRREVNAGVMRSVS